MISVTGSCGRMPPAENSPAAQMNTYEEMNVMKAVVVDKNYLIGCLYKDICIKDNNCHIG
jgi:hypothetical protein